MAAVGGEFTVTDEVVLLQPVVALVNVNVTLPTDTPVTTPPFVMVAFELSLLTHVPPEVGLRVIVLPIQTCDDALTAGNAFTVKLPELDPVTIGLVDTTRNR
jgi:hypothetical protein